MQCTFCQSQLADTEGSVVPSAAMEAGIRAGFSPEMSPSWDAMKQTATEALSHSGVPITDQALVDGWKKNLAYPGRVWRFCDHCFPALLPYLPNKNKVANDGMLSLIVPIHTSPWAIFASYAGLFAVTIVLAPIALILGIIALRDLRANPTLNGRGRAIFAIIMGIVFSLPLLIFLVAAVFG